MSKINEDWSFPQPSIKCNYCIQHTVKLPWCVCWDIIYATYLQRSIDLFLWMFYKRVSWVQVQGNMGLLGLIYNLINNDQSLELDSSLHFYCDLTLEFCSFAVLFRGGIILTFGHADLVTCLTHDLALIRPGCTKFGDRRPLFLFWLSYLIVCTLGTLLASPRLSFILWKMEPIMLLRGHYLLRIKWYI